MRDRIFYHYNIPMLKNKWRPSCSGIPQHKRRQLLNEYDKLIHSIQIKSKKFNNEECAKAEKLFEVIYSPISPASITTLHGESLRWK